MRHDELARQIRGLIQEEDYDRAQTLLPEYVRVVTEECLERDDFLRARTFLKSACEAVKIRRAHYLRGMAAVECQRAYSTVADRKSIIDCTG